MRYLTSIMEDALGCACSEEVGGRPITSPGGYESHLQLPGLTVFGCAIAIQDSPTQGTDPEWLRPDTRVTGDADWPTGSLLASGRTQRALAGPQPRNELPSIRLPDVPPIAAWSPPFSLPQTPTPFITESSKKHV
jgi:hypothetical protein